MDKTGKVCYALVAQINAVSVERFTNPVGNIDPGEIAAIRRVIQICF